MLHSISYSVRFPTTGRTLSENVSFQKGLGAIVGPNEAGKSFVVEMIRYALFGSAALRGVADDYKNLSVELHLSIRKDDYRIVRNSKVVGIWKGDEQLATGVKPVNAKMLEILGYDLSVFDIANVANQGDIERLLAMRPTERKNMIDRVIGLDRLDELAKWCGQEALGLAREAGVLEASLREPQEPARPQETDVGILEERVSRLRSYEAELNQQLGILGTRLEEPKLPQDEFPGITLEYAEQKARGQTDLQREIARLSALPLPSSFDNAELEGMLEQHEQYDLWRQSQAFASRHPKPTLSYAEVLEGFEAHRLEEHRASLKRQLETAVASGTARCPCGQEFELEHHTIVRLEEALNALPAARSVPDLATLRNQEARHKDWNSKETNEKCRQFMTVQETTPPVLSRSTIMIELRKNAEAADPSVLRELREQLADEPIDWPTVLAAKQSFTARMSAYDTLKAHYDDLLVQRQRATEAATRLRDEVEKLRHSDQALAEARAYHMQLKRYETDLLAFNELKARLADLKAREAGYRACRTAIALVRTKVKAFIIPSLNKVASHLLADMTGGQRQSVAIDADFENIIIDGQPIDTLSGSGKACASLAIRIGLGQVLTNNVLSLFIGDEIDASMDKDRANNVSELLASLNSRILQLLLVTHKSPTADYTIRIGDKLNEAA